GPGGPSSPRRRHAPARRLARSATTRLAVLLRPPDNAGQNQEASLFGCRRRRNRGLVPSCSRFCCFRDYTRDHPASVSSFQLLLYWHDIEAIARSHWRSLLNASQALAGVEFSVIEEAPMEPGGLVRVERRLAAILAADVAGYSRLIGADEGGTLERLRTL